MLRVLVSPECYREAVAAIQLDAGGCLRKYSGRTTVPILSIANKLDLIRNRREYTQLSPPLVPLRA